MEKLAISNIEQLYREIASDPLNKRINFEMAKILEILKGFENIRAHIQYNSKLQVHVKKFKDENSGRIQYQGLLSVGFRDFLIEQPEIKRLIEEDMKGKNYFSTDESKHEKFYDFMEKFYIRNGRVPTTSELYNTFLNFKS